MAKGNGAKRWRQVKKNKAGGEAKAEENEAGRDRERPTEAE